MIEAAERFILPLSLFTSVPVCTVAADGAYHDIFGCMFETGELYHRHFVTAAFQLQPAKTVGKVFGKPVF